MMRHIKSSLAVMRIAAKNAKDREEKEKNLGVLVRHLLVAKVLIKLFQKFGPRQGWEFSHER